MKVWCSEWKAPLLASALYILVRFFNMSFLVFLGAMPSKFYIINFTYIETILLFKKNGKKSTLTETHQLSFPSSIIILDLSRTVMQNIKVLQDLRKIVSILPSASYLYVCLPLILHISQVFYFLFSIFSIFFISNVAFWLTAAAGFSCRKWPYVLLHFTYLK